MRWRSEAALVVVASAGAGNSTLVRSWSITRPQLLETTFILLVQLCLWIEWITQKTLFVAPESSKELSCHMAGDKGSCFGTCSLFPYERH